MSKKNCLFRFVRVFWLPITRRTRKRISNRWPSETTARRFQNFSDSRRNFYFYLRFNYKTNITIEQTQRNNNIIFLFTPQTKTFFRTDRPASQRAWTFEKKKKEKKRPSGVIRQTVIIIIVI